MKILITSGGTTENIDSVRGITNHSTGSLGKCIAEQFLAHGHEVTLVTTKSAIKPVPQEHLTLNIVSNVDSLLKTLEPLVKENDVLIHSMAVSDYTPVYMASLDEVEKLNNLSQLLSKKNEEPKISSKADHQVLFLEKTPKIITLVKQWNSDIKLIGFKLLVNVEKEKLFAVARDSLTKNQANYILANDLTEITSTQHHAYLIDQEHVYEANTKAEIAQLIFEKVTEND